MLTRKNCVLWNQALWLMKPGFRSIPPPEKKTKVSISGPISMVGLFLVDHQQRVDQISREIYFLRKSLGMEESPRQKGRNFTPVAADSKFVKKRIYVSTHKESREFVDICFMRNHRNSLTRDTSTKGKERHSIKALK